MKNKKIFGFPELFRRGIIAWLTASLILYLSLGRPGQSLEGTTGLENMSFLTFLILWAVIMAALHVGVWMLGEKVQTEKIERWGMAAVFAAQSVIALGVSFTVPFLGAVLILQGMLVLYAVRGWESPKRIGEKKDRAGEKIKTSEKCSLVFIVIFSLLFFAFVSVWTVCRVWTFSTPTYDFGIFSQMFHQMKETGLPVTTLERDGPLSHFQVHVSPIYYLMLPFYLVFPRPETLQILQAGVLTSAVLPLWLICKKKRLPSAVGVFFAALLFLYPAFSGGTSYDLHENVFLAPLILWLFCGIECRNTWMTGLAAALTLLVKEDAAIYVAVVGLWLWTSGMLREERDRRAAATGAALFVGAVLWFALVTGYLARFGDGVMTYRYKNFMFGGSSSLVTVIEAALLQPMKVVYECVDVEKVPFIALTVLPLLGLPLWTRRYERLILLIPYILVNLMSDYQYQHDIFFQYTFGSTACLFYLALLNVEDLIKRGCARGIYAILMAAVLASGYCFGVTVTLKAVSYVEKYRDNREYYGELSAFLEQIPREASVAATTFFTTALSNREILYDVRYASEEHLFSVEYLVLNPKDKVSYEAYRGEDKSGYEGLTGILEEKGYQIWMEMGESVAIYRRACQAIPGSQIRNIMI